MEHLVSAFACALCDEYQSQLWKLQKPFEYLFEKTTISHAVMIVIDTRGRILFRSGRDRNFSKHGSGGGLDGYRSLVQCHYDCRRAVFTLFGIGFSNPAVLEVSQPIITTEAPHENERKESAPATNAT